MHCAGSSRGPWGLLRPCGEGAPRLRGVALCLQTRGVRGCRPPVRVEAQTAPGAPSPLPSCAHLLHAPPPRLTPPRTRETPSSCPYFPRCNLSCLLMNVGLSFFFFPLMGGRELGIPEGTLFTVACEDPFPLFFQGRTLLCFPLPVLRPALARVPATFLIFGLRFSVPLSLPLPASGTAFPSLSGSGPGFGGFPLPLSILLGFVFLPGGDCEPS